MGAVEKIKDGLRELKKNKEALEVRIRKGEKLLKQEQKKRDEKIYKAVIEESIGCKSDYAGFATKDYGFYYGYEELDYHPLRSDEVNDEDKKTWAFSVINNQQEVIYKRAIDPEHVEWSCLAGLIAGIGYWIEESGQVTVKAKDKVGGE